MVSSSWMFWLLGLHAFQLGHHSIVTRYASHHMAIFFAHDGGLVLVLHRAIYLGEGNESLAAKIQTFL